VRTGVGLFDISHMGRVQLHGPGAKDLLQQLSTNDVSALAPGRAHYSLLTNPEGGIIDDIIVYCTGAEDYWLIINASNSEKDEDWIRSHAAADVKIEDWTDRTAMIAVQGPQAPALVARFGGEDLLQTDRFTIVRREVRGIPTAFCSTGYTGED